MGPFVECNECPSIRALVGYPRLGPRRPALSGARGSQALYVHVYASPEPSTVWDQLRELADGTNRIFRMPVVGVTRNLSPRIRPVPASLASADRLASPRLLSPPLPSPPLPSPPVASPASLPPLGFPPLCPFPPLHPSQSPSPSPSGYPQASVLCRTKSSVSSSRGQQRLSTPVHCNSPNHV